MAPPSRRCRVRAKRTVSMPAQLTDAVPAGFSLAPITLRLTQPLARATSAVSACVSRCSSSGVSAARCRGEPRAAPDRRCSQQRAVDQHAIDARERERRDGAGLEAGRRLDLVGARDPRVPRADGARDAARVGAPVAGDEGDDGRRRRRRARASSRSAERAADRVGRLLRGRAVSRAPRAAPPRRPRGGTRRPARPAPATA